jgi:hypothetical protein
VAASCKRLTLIIKSLFDFEWRLVSVIESHEKKGAYLLLLSYLDEEMWLQC